MLFELVKLYQIQKMTTSIFRILIIDNSRLLAKAINDALEAGLEHIEGTKVQIETYRGHRPFRAEPGDPETVAPQMEQVVRIIENNDLILLGDRFWHFSASDFIPYCEGRRVIATSSQINGFNRFTEKDYLRRGDRDSKYLEAATSLCNLVRAEILREVIARK